MLLEIFYLEEVDTLEVVNLPPGHSHSVRGHLASLVHHLDGQKQRLFENCWTDEYYRGHCWQVQEIEGVLEGAGRPTVVEDTEY